MLQRIPQNLLHTFYIIIIIAILLFFIFWIKSIVDAIKSEFKKDNDKIAWIILLVSIPPLATILYDSIAKKQKKDFNVMMVDNRKPLRPEEANEPKPF